MNDGQATEGVWERGGGLAEFLDFLDTAAPTSPQKLTALAHGLQNASMAKRGAPSKLTPEVTKKSARRRGWVSSRPAVPGMPAYHRKC